MPLYTFIADYKGGTYISQVTASSEIEALFTWATNLNVNEMSDFASRSKELLLQELNERVEEGWGYVALTGIINGWCASPYVRGSCMLVHFFKTDPDNSPS